MTLYWYSDSGRGLDFKPFQSLPFLPLSSTASMESPWEPEPCDELSLRVVRSGRLLLRLGACEWDCYSQILTLGQSQRLQFCQEMNPRSQWQGLLLCHSHDSVRKQHRVTTTKTATPSGINPASHSGFMTTVFLSPQNSAWGSVTVYIHAVVIWHFLWESVDKSLSHIHYGCQLFTHFNCDLQFSPYFPAINSLRIRKHPGIPQVSSDGKYKFSVTENKDLTVTQTSRL